MATVDFVRSHTFTDLVKAAVYIYFKYFWAIFPICLAALLPLHVLGDLSLLMLKSEDMLESENAEFITIMVFLSQMLIQLLIFPFLTGITTAIIHEICKGSKPSFRYGVAIAVQKFWPLLAVSLRAGIYIGLASIALIIPGLYLIIRWYLVNSIVVAEGVRSADALKRSSELTRGYRWRILGMVLLQILFSFFVGLSASWFLPEEVVYSSADINVMSDVYWFSFIFDLTLQSLVTPLSYIVTALIYYDLRSRKENYDIRPIFDAL
jgi:hypothetical protein